MKKEGSDDYAFLEKLNSVDKAIFKDLSEEEKRMAVTENKLAHQEEKLRRDNEQTNQLTDRIASKSFQ